jgi:hypothetical protein
MKPVTLTEMCLNENETCSKVLIVKNLSDAFPIQNGLKQRYASSLLFFSYWSMPMMSEYWAKT